MVYARLVNLASPRPAPIVILLALLAIAPLAIGSAAMEVASCRILCCGEAPDQDCHAIADLRVAPDGSGIDTASRIAASPGPGDAPHGGCDRCMSVCGAGTTPAASTPAWVRPASPMEKFLADRGAARGTGAPSERFRPPRT